MRQFDILPLYRSITSNFLKILISSFIFFLVGLAAATTRTDPFRAEALILPPSEKDLKGMILAQIPLNRSDSPEIFDLLTHSSVFQKFKMNLASRATQLSFLEQQGFRYIPEMDTPPSYHTKSADGFSKRVRGRDFAELVTEWRLKKEKSIHLPLLGFGDPTISFGVESDHTASRPYLVLSVEWSDPQIAAQIANSYADYVNAETEREVKELLFAGLGIRIRNIEDMIAYQRKRAERLYADYLYELQEAIGIAKDLGLENPDDAFGNFNIIQITPPPKFFVHPDSQATPYSPSSAQRHLPLYHPGNLLESQSKATSLTQLPPLYASGWQALEKEYEAISRRPSSDFFIPNIASLQGQLDWMKSIDPEEVVFNTAQITHPAIPPSLASNLSDVSVALLAALLGLVLSVTWTTARSVA